MDYSKKAKKILSKTKSPFEVHPFKTISITDLNWLVDSIKTLDSEKKAYENEWDILKKDFDFLSKRKKVQDEIHRELIGLNDKRITEILTKTREVG